MEFSVSILFGLAGAFALREFGRRPRAATQAAFMRRRAPTALAALASWSVSLAILVLDHGIERGVAIGLIVIMAAMLPVLLFGALRRPDAAGAPTAEKVGGEAS